MQTVTSRASLIEGTSLLDRLFVVIDYTPASRVAFATALELQDAHGSALCLFHSGESDPSDDWLGGIGSPCAYGMPSWEAQARLARFVANVAPAARDRVELRARVGDPLETIPQEAREWGATLVIAPARARRDLFSSRAEQLVHRIRIPTLILPT